MKRALKHVQRRKTYKITVIGSSVAGATAATFMHRNGHQVRVLEKVVNPIKKGAGFMIQPIGLNVIRMLDQELLEKCVQTSSTLTRLYGEDVNNRFNPVLDLHYQDLRSDYFALGIDRGWLYLELQKVLKKHGVVAEYGVEALKLTKLPNGEVQVTTNDPDKDWCCDIVVLATGSLQPIPELMNMDISRKVNKYPYGAHWGLIEVPKEDQPSYYETYPPHELYNQYCGSRYMFGLMHTGVGKSTVFWSTNLSKKTEHMDNLNEFKQFVLSKTPKAKKALQYIHSLDQLTLASYADTHMKGFNTVQNNHPIVFIGDCAHAMSPQLGQGANLALYDAYKLSEALKQIGSRDEILKSYSNSRKKHIRYYQITSKMLTPLFQSEFGWSLFRNIFLGLGNQLSGFVYKQSLLSLVGLKSRLFNTSKEFDQILKNK
eukprot:TRINITY_DN8786_c0_g1_i1.p1 TRINITY_DN8786_c0_g1~~TRINITY_DN8786_c0_g1_i1.p1  ORF type:complete len:446 (+),score=66.08 TRINITY_DN8786_c0_g1_i1:51-1340(+)